MRARIPAGLIGMCALWTLWGAAVGAQERAGAGRVQLIVRDEFAAAIVGAEVTLVGPGRSKRTAVTTDTGEATFEGLPAGAYTATIESAGFEAKQINDLRLTATGRLTRTVELKISGFAAQVEVTPNAGTERLRESSTSLFTPEQIAALPDDPDELEDALRQIIGSDLELRIDGFDGVRLPPGMQIQEVRVVWDASANSGAGGPRVEVRTRPATNRWRSGLNVTFRDESLNARNAFAATRPVGQARDVGWTASGPLVKDKTGVSLWIDRSNTLDQLVVRAAAPGGLVSATAEQPGDRSSVWLRVNHTVDARQDFQVDLAHTRSSSSNLGIGGFDLPERAYAQDRAQDELHLAHHATIRGRMINNVRFQLRDSSSTSTSTTDARTIQVLDAFTSGGAQLEGGRHAREVQLEESLEFTIRERHEMSFGTAVNGGSYHGDESRNAAGTFTFASLDAYGAGLPTTYTARIGNPAFDYSLYRFNWHVQDNFNLRPGLVLNLGLRHDFQTHIDDWTNFAPRLGVGWTIPRTKTTLRVSTGMFYQGFTPALFEPTVVVNGQRQHDIIVVNPAFPDPFAGGAVASTLPAAITRARPDLVLPSSRRVSFGVVQPIAWATLRATYARRNGSHQFRSIDANAPVDGVRPDPTVSTVTELESTGRSFNESLDLRVSIRRPQRHFSTSLSYTLARAMNDTDGPFVLPPDSADLSGEWGPSRQDIRHRFSTWVATDLWANLKISGSLRAQSAAPYTITTGFDANGDGIANERPSGVGRNSVRGASSTNLDLTLTWGRWFGQHATEEPPAVPDPANAIVRFEIFARATNVLNTVNPLGFSGVLTSPFFGRPTSAAAARRIVLGTRLWF
jgi:hypothetical protein